MLRPSRKVLVLAAIAAVAPAAAQAQYYGSAAPAPLYPYAVQNSYGVQADQPYAVEVAPNTYVIQRSAPARTYPYVRNQNTERRVSAPVPTPAQNAKRFDRPLKPVDHKLVEELRNRHQKKDTVINTTKIVRDPPVVVETQRIVNDPPRIITRRHVVDDEAGTVETDTRPSRDDNKKRVIRAEAEVTILGPDRMSIRLFRKGDQTKANARAD